jgi:hypothetical protein
MLQSSCGGVESGGRVPPTCPTCHKPLTPKLACWSCCDRLCRYCGGQTGSAFIEVCWPCWFQMTAKEEKLDSLVGTAQG